MTGSVLCNAPHYPGAERVVVTKSFPGPGTCRYRLASCDETGSSIGDDRDYELLKIFMSPLASLAEDLSDDLKYS